MTKGKFILIVVFMIVLFSTVIYLNYDKIENFINNKQWELVDSIATIFPDKYLATASMGKDLIVVESDKVSGYTNSNVKTFSIDTTFKSVILDDEQEYCVIGEDGGSKLILLADEKKLWEFDTTGELLSVSVNKNGYVACIYAKNGYKSLIKVLKPSGEEMFTNYFASTYAVDAEISNDNKYVAIAEANVEGINVESDIKIIDMNNVQAEAIETIKLENNTLLLDIEYTDKNELLILSDKKIEKLNANKEKETIKEYKPTEVSHVTIENRANAILVEKKDTGIFSTEYILKIQNNATDEAKEYILESAPKQIYAKNKTIAIDMGNEILFLNTNAKLMKRCRLGGQVKEIRLYDNGNMASLVFRDRIEIIKL